MKLHKEMTNLEIADLLRSIAASYHFKNQKENRFKIVAYERAADAIEHLSSEIKDVWDDGKLTEVPGIGKSIASHLDELFRTGKSRHFQTVMRNLPANMFELLKVPGIGPKIAYKLATSFKLSKSNPLRDLQKAAQKGKIETLEGFGKDSQESILKAVIAAQKKKGKRMLLNRAEIIASEIIFWMKKEGEVKRVDPLGSLRRRASTIGDIDISVATNNVKKAIEHFCNYPDKKRVLEKGEASAAIILPGEIQVDLKAQTPQSYGALLQHFTGSKHHNIALREYALKKGLSLSEYGIKKIRSSKHEIREFRDEESFYEALGLAYIPPELREDAGEIESALKHSLPTLVELKDVKGDLQIHSDFDIETSHDVGESSMEEIIFKANELGYEYLAFTEHNPSQSKHLPKQVIDLLKRKKDKIGKLNYSLDKGVKKGVKKVFNSLEVDILPPGKLAIDEKALTLLDFALISIHSSFDQTKKEITKRVLSALAHPKVKIFAHPTARMLGKREGVDLDWEQVFDYCLKNDKWLEINAEPTRLDLPDILVRDAVKKGIKMTLGTDAHHVDGLDNMRYGVFVARRGWAEKRDIVNTRNLKEFEKMLKSY